VHRSQVGELFYISHVANVGSIVRSGILSHNRAASVTHTKVDLDTVQEIRSHKRISPTRMLHDHANLYFCGRNAMMYHVVRHNPIDAVCLIRVSADVLDLPDVVVMDGNAARWESRPYDAASGIAALDFDRIHAQYWTHPGDPVAHSQHMREKQAEVLVPDIIDPRFITGFIVPTDAAATAIGTGAGRRPIAKAPYPFFPASVWRR
jgi:hypothetical protein